MSDARERYERWKGAHELTGAHAIAYVESLEAEVARLRALLAKVAAETIVNERWPRAATMLDIEAALEVLHADELE